MLKQDKICGWCRKTDELVLMGQGGGVHTVCPECGSTGPYLSTNEVGKAYRELRARVARLEKALKRGIELHENCDADTCMCGESMLHPLSDHKPTAMLQYYGDQWVEEARRALEEK